MSASEAGVGKSRSHGFERNVYLLGATSFLTDASNNMVFPLMALFLDNVLGVKPGPIGFVEGVVECASSLLKMLSGWLSDRMHRRKGLIAGGYWISALTKAFLIIAGSWWFVLLVRLVDRMGKGLRAAPAQAMVADESQVGREGHTFGFYKMMDVGGGMVGLLASAGVVYLAQGGDLLLTQSTYQTLVLIGIVPALLGAVLVLQLAKKSQQRHLPSKSLPALSLAALGSRFRLFLIIVCLFNLGDFSTAFLTLRAQDFGASAVQVVLLLVALRLVYSLVAWPAGALSDRFGRKRILIGGWMLHAAVYLGFALVGRGWQLVALYLLYGLYLGLTKGVERAFVADLVPASGPRGAAYGVYSASVGVTALLASSVAGFLWQTVAPEASFFLGASLALLAVFLLAIPMRWW